MSEQGTPPKKPKVVPVATESKKNKYILGKIKLRAFLINQATKDYTLDNWLQAERECKRNPNFNHEIDILTQHIVEECDCSYCKITWYAARGIGKFQYIREAAYYIYENWRKSKEDWYLAEKSLDVRIIELKNDILSSEPELTHSEAYCKAKDQLYPAIQEKAYNRRGWIETRAYFLSQENPENSSKDNWCAAAQEYDNNLYESEAS